MKGLSGRFRGMVGERYGEPTIRLIMARMPAASEGPPREFWIDVGGTFTDCIAATPGGRLRLHKLLSTGRYVGTVGRGSTRERIVDPSRASDPPGFFNGWRLRLLDGTDTDDALVANFDPATGQLSLAAPLPRASGEGERYELACDQEAPLIGIRWLLGCGLNHEFGDITIRLGTTRATNALLERRGAATAFVTTAGFGDLLVIGDQTRPKLFDLNVRKPRPLYQQVVELEERIDAQGRVLKALDEHKIEDRLEAARRAGIDVLAVCLLNSYRNPIHEEAVARVAARKGFRAVSISSRLGRFQRVVPRAQTTVVDAYVGPVIREYLERIRRDAPRADIQVMTSSGAVMPTASVVAKDAILSGPAGGVVGCAKSAERAGFDKVIGFDMGGTSTDVSRFDGVFDRTDHVRIQDRETGAFLRISTPALRIETVAAGGGSICGFDGVRPTVGPQSAGASPGPACYGMGGPLCITDVNLYLGRIVARRFPIPLDRDAVERRLDEMIERILAATGRRYAREELAAGYVAIANAAMTEAIKRISTQLGYDPREYALVSFGGAGSQHACSLARGLGIRRILCHPYASLLSAFGIGVAEATRFAAEEIRQELAALRPAELEARFERMAATLQSELRAEGFATERIGPARCSMDLRYAGQESTINVVRPADGEWRAAFETLHARTNGFTLPGRAVQAVTARVERTGIRPAPPLADDPTHSSESVTREMMPVCFDGHWIEARAYDREHLRAEMRFEGPAIVAEAGATIFVPPGWNGEVTKHGDIVLTDGEASAGNSEQRETIVGRSPHPDPLPEREGKAADPVTLELFHQQFAGVAEQMGAALERTALSVNVKERLDFSCAVYDARGDLVSHAAHIPVHIGAMGQCVKCLMGECADGKWTLRPGDSFVTNDPYRGGSHLPDVTVITPVFDADGRELRFLVANRAHHAEIGGIAPGSMPPASRCLADEGVLIRMTRLTRGDEGHSRVLDDEIRRLLTEAPHPSRSPEQNIADLHAQLAANHRGAVALGEMVVRHGAATVQRYMQFIQQAAESKMRGALGRLGDRSHSFVDALDDGAPLAVRVNVGGGSAVVDFKGTGPVLANNLNATPAIVASAVLYCFRCLIEEEIPLNAGILRAIRIILPECFLNPPYHDDPRACAAVAGGNVETSQRIVDAVFGALGVVAASQGTMNNLTFGDASFGYYETIGGGTGAGPTFDGAEAVHSHMTNTRLTDPEVLEDRYPVRLRRFAVRRGSGGAGEHRGGDGIIREFEFLAALQASLVTQRRTRGPYGLAGGAAGRAGRNVLTRAGSGEIVELPSLAQFSVAPGDVLLIETPGGGGYGRRHDA